MTSARDAFLQRLRRAVQAGNRPGESGPVAPRDGVGYQGAGQDPAGCFCREFAAAGGQSHPVPDRESAIARVIELVRSKSAQRVLVGRQGFLDAHTLTERLRSLGIEAVAVDQLAPDDCREAFFSANVGISGVDYLIAETGTVVLRASPWEPRSLSLLPPVHIAVADRSQIVPDLFDLFERNEWSRSNGPPSCLSLITGPSKTGDIELRLVTGVHGPGEIHLILIGG